MKNRAMIISIFLIFFGPLAFVRGDSATKINAYFFYEEICGLCHEDEEEFSSILNEKLPFDERNKYPNNFQLINIFNTQGSVEYKRVTDELGLDRGLLQTPFMVLGGRVFQGYDSISNNIREAYLTAAEALYVYNRPYNPRTKKSGANLFDDYAVNPDQVTIVYFYRITCPECAQVTPIIDGFPKTVSVNGRERALDIIRINTRSGNNSERVAAFFDAWQVPDKDRMVPIVFFSDSYLAGIEAISSGIHQHLSEPPMQWRLLPERR